MNKAILEKFERKTEKCIEYLLFLSRYSDNYNIFEINSVLDRGYIGVGCLRRKKDQKMIIASFNGQLYELDCKLQVRLIETDCFDEIIHLTELNNFSNYLMFATKTGFIYILNCNTNEKLHKFQISLSENEQIVEFFIDEQIFNIKSNFLEFYCITNKGKIYFIKKGLILVDITEIMDCGMEIKVFLEGKTMIFCYQCYIYIIEDNFQKIREINLNQFVERNIFSTDMFAFMIGNDEIWVFYKEKILIFETEYFEISQILYFDFTMIFVKKIKNDFGIIAKRENGSFLMFMRLEELRKQDFNFKTIFHLDFELLDQIKDFDVWSPKKELPIVILLKNGGCYVLDYFNNVLNLFQKGKYFFILIHKSDSKIIRVIQNIMRPIKREENLDYDTDFQKYLKVKDNIAQNRYFELNEKNLILCARYNPEIFCKVVKNKNLPLDLAMNIAEIFDNRKAKYKILQKMGRYYESIEYLCSTLKLYDKALKFTLKNKPQISELELLKTYNYFQILLKTKKGFLPALTNNKITLDDIIQTKFSSPLLFLENRKLCVLQKTNYILQILKTLEITKNILELAHMSYMSEFQKNERRKIVQNTKAIYMGKTPVFCVSCDKKINVLNEEIIIFQHCNHFLHFSCIDGENPKCKKCLQQTKSIKNNVIRYKQ